MTLFSGLRSGLRSGLLSGLNPAGIDLSGRRLVGLLGQSNGSGFAPARDVMIADGYTGNFTGTYTFERVAHTNGDPLLWVLGGGASGTRGPVPISPRPNDTDGSLGLESSLARYLDHAVPNGWVIGKITVAGSSLHQNWQPVGSLYPTALPHLIDQAILKLQEWEDLTGSPLSAILWQQGENDCTNATFAAAYQTNLENLIDKFRVTWPGIPWIINRLHTGAGGSDNTTVRTAQAAVVGTRTGVTLVDLDPLSITTLHFTANQYVRAGRLDAIAVLAALGINSPPFADFRAFGSGTSVQFTDLSTDGDGTISAWDWDWGDGSAHGTTQNPTHVYAAPGTYTVKMTATDDDALTEQATRSVIVATNAWSLDGTSGKAVPNTGTELAAFFAACGLTSTGTALWRLQEASGVAADSIGTVTLTPNNGPTYAQAVAGWTRVGIKFTDGTNNQRLLNSTTAPNPALTPCLLFALVSLPAAPAAIRDIMGLVGNVDLRLLTTGKLRFVSGGGASVGDLENVAASTVQPLILRSDPGGAMAAFTEQERFYGTSQVPTSATQVFFAGQTAAAAAATYLYAFELSGSSAQLSDDQIRTVLRTAGWNPTW